MAKGDQGNIQSQISDAKTKSDANTQAGLDDQRARLKQQQAQKDKEHQQALEGYTDQQKTGGINQEYIDWLSKPTQLGNGQLSSSGQGMNEGGSSGGGGGGGSSPSPAPAGPSYLDTFRELMGKTGGYDPDRLNNINSDSKYLRDSTGKYGVVDKAISDLGQIDHSGTKGAISDLGNIKFDATGKAISDLQNIDQSGNKDTVQRLKDFASTGGVSQEDLARINRPMLEEFERTGGYSADDLANVRNRSNSAVPSMYKNLTNSIDRGSVGSIRNPGSIGANSGSMARQEAQAQGDQVRNTELGISDTVRSGRMDASKTLAANNLTLQGIKGQNTLGGYGAAGNIGLGITGQEAAAATSAGQLDIGRGTAQAGIATNKGNLNLGITGQQADAMRTQGGLGLTKQQQIDQARAQAAGIDVGVQSDINKARMGGAGGLQTEALTRASIGAQSGAAAAANSSANARFMAQQDAQNQQFLAHERQQGSQFGTSGTAQLSRDSAQQEQFNQSLLRGYGQDQAGNDQGWINSGIANNASNKTDWMGGITKGIGALSGVPWGSILPGGGGGDPSGSGAYNDWGNHADNPSGGATPPEVPVLSTVPGYPPNPSAGAGPSSYWNPSTAGNPVFASASSGRPMAGQTMSADEIAKNNQLMQYA